ncbi:MAG: ribonuclease III [Acidobacteriia bacterium]|nr:ribonuclease III [Terriglobia bacterium]
MEQQKISALEHALGHHFGRPALLEQALTHSSHAHESEARADEGPGAADNEQLEFLGDAVLGFVTSQVLFERFPHFQEGQLSKMRAHLVSARHLVRVARDLDLGRYLRLGRGEEKSGGRAKSALLVDALEAVLAAMYLDSGIAVPQRFIVERILNPELQRLEQQSGGVFPVTDHKSALQEFLQGGGRPQPIYSVVKEQGPEHNKLFTVEVRVRMGTNGAGDYVTHAEGPTKKTAEQRAARQALADLRALPGQAAHGADE